METIDDEFTQAFGATPSEIQGKITSWLSKRRDILRVRFDMPLSKAMDILLYYYQYEVQSRDRKFRLDDNVKSGILNVAKNMVEPIPKKWIMMSGLYGNGKTTLAKALFAAINLLNDERHFKYEGKNSEHRKLSLRKVKAIDICQNVGDKELFHLYKTVDVLYIDDLGVESKAVQFYGNGSFPVREVLEARYDNQLFTILTTNLTSKELREYYEGRITDRFREETLQIAMKGESYRTQNNKTE